ncbi:uncharacterized protein LOC121731881 [Aricia agestis]|uniref:uncharacterized protein LOC121731881 n=1 Tax=Aricia agestis TaxID=91739 RepID=UPI001C202AC1|nr:uncharacterized protein LOC121731881 [Aricia agestis]
MYSVVEFSEDDSVAIVRSSWISPTKKHSAWPPFKNSEKIKKCLTGTILDDDTWNVFGIRRIFYVTDDLLSARKKCKEAELNSEVELDIELKRKHKKTTRYLSVSSEEEDDGHGMNFPKPPKEPGRKQIAEETKAEMDNTGKH